VAGGGPRQRRSFGLEFDTPIEPIKTTLNFFTAELMRVEAINNPPDTGTEPPGGLPQHTPRTRARGEEAGPPRPCISSAACVRTARQPRNCPKAPGARRSAGGRLTSVVVSVGGGRRIVGVQLAKAPHRRHADRSANRAGKSRVVAGTPGDSGRYGADCGPPLRYPGGFGGGPRVDCALILGCRYVEWHSTRRSRTSRRVSTPSSTLAGSSDGVNRPGSARGARGCGRKNGRCDGPTSWS